MRVSIFIVKISPCTSLIQKPNLPEGNTEEILFVEMWNPILSKVTLFYGKGVWALK